jgi:DNA polymerase III subunit beta
MFLEIEKSRLLKPLALVSSVVEKRQTLPILSNLFLQLEDGRLTITSTDLEVEISIVLEDVKGENGICTVTARKLHDIVRALPDASVLKLRVDGKGALIQSGRSRFKLQTLPAEDFPGLETRDWEERLRLPERQLRNLLESTAFAMALQDVRYFLNGVLIEIRDHSMRAVATDGHRLAKNETSLAGGPYKTRQTIVPRKAVMEMMRFLEDSETELTMEINASHVRLSNDYSTLTTKLIDGRFPDYETVTAQVLSVELLIDRAEFLDVLNRTAILTNDKFRGVRVHVENDLLSVVAHNPEQEEASDEIPVEYEGSEIDIGFNVNYLIDALKAVPGASVVLRLKDSASGCVIQEPGNTEALYLVMPMRL